MIYFCFFFLSVSKTCFGSYNSHISPMHLLEQETFALLSVYSQHHEVKRVYFEMTQLLKQLCVEMRDGEKYYSMGFPFGKMLINAKCSRQTFCAGHWFNTESSKLCQEGHVWNKTQKESAYFFASKYFMAWIELYKQTVLAPFVNISCCDVVFQY